VIPVNAPNNTEAVKSEGKNRDSERCKSWWVHVDAGFGTRAKGESESSLGIVFDKAILKNGQEIPFGTQESRRLLQHRAGALGCRIGDGYDGWPGRFSGGFRAAGGAAAERLAGVTSTAGGAVGTVTNTAANVGWSWPAEL